MEKKFLNYHLKTAETVAKSAETAEKTASPEAVARAARIAAAAKKQAKAKQAAAGKAKAKAKAKASEKEERCLLAEAVKAVAKATKAAKAGKAAAAEVKPDAEPAKDQDGAAGAARAEAAMATAEATEAEAARLGAEVALPLVQARFILCRQTLHRLALSHASVRHECKYVAAAIPCTSLANCITHVLMVTPSSCYRLVHVMCRLTTRMDGTVPESWCAPTNRRNISCCKRQSNGSSSRR